MAGHRCPLGEMITSRAPNILKGNSKEIPAQEAYQVSGMGERDCGHRHLQSRVCEPEPAPDESASTVYCKGLWIGISMESLCSEKFRKGINLLVEVGGVSG